MKDSLGIEIKVGDQVRLQSHSGGYEYSSEYGGAVFFIKEIKRKFVILNYRPKIKAYFENIFKVVPDKNKYSGFRNVGKYIEERRWT